MTARRRTAGLSWVAAKIAGNPAVSPIAPSAATAASRTRASSCSRANALSRETTAGSARSRSPHANAAISTTDSSMSSRRGSSGTSSRAAASSAALRLTVGSSSCSACISVAVSSARERARAPRAVARTTGSRSARSVRAIETSPVWPAIAAARRRAAALGASVTGPRGRGSALRPSPLRRPRQRATSPTR